jgi:toxin CptA
MHSAPAVSFPVGRSRFQMMVLVVTWLLGGAGCAYWVADAEGADWRQAITFAMLLLGGLCAVWQLKQSPLGELKWEGEHWVLQLAPTLRGTAPSPAQVGDVSLQADLQFFMLLRFQDLARRTYWLWLDRSAPQTRWLALRRAVHGRVKDVKSHIDGKGDQ